MTDKETILEILNRAKEKFADEGSVCANTLGNPSSEAFDVAVDRHAPEDRPPQRKDCPETSSIVLSEGGGYPGFYTVMTFRKDGSLMNVGAWE